MRYIFKINICTDGDFDFRFVPRGMKFDAGYTFKKEYNDKDTAIKDIADICEFLKEQIYTNKDYVREAFNECVDGFMHKICKPNTATNIDIYEYMSGKYDETKFVFYAEEQYIDCGFYVTDEEYAMIKASNKSVTNKMFKEAYLALFK